MQSYLLLLPGLLAGALTILTLVLVKGEICPGQRGRIHKILPVLAGLWLPCALFAIESLAIASGVVYFWSKVNTGKTREQGPLWLLYGVNGLAWFSLLVNSWQLGGAVLVLQQLMWSLVAGSLLAHLMLLQAKSRLKAFHRLLPLAGIVGLMGLVALFGWQAYQLGEAQIGTMGLDLGAGFLACLVGCAIWCWHLFRHQDPEKVQLATALVVMLAANRVLLPLYAFAF